MKKLYRGKIKSEYVTNIACCALDKVHAFKIIEQRLKEYGLTDDEYKIIKIWHAGTCNWEIENSIIYN